MGQEVVAAQGISKSYNSVVALDAVSFTVRPSEVYVFIGPNGAGKSTLFNIIAGVMKPTSGSIRVLGGSPFDPSTRLKISYLPATPPLYPWLTVMENVDFYASLYGFNRNTVRQEAKWLFEKLGVQELETRLSSKLSTGQMKLASIILSLAIEAELLILDEPTTALDPAMRRSVLELLRKKVSNRVTILMATHLVDEAEGLANRVAIIDKGKLIAEGSAEELKKLYAPPAVLVIKPVPEQVENASAVLKSRWGNVYSCNGEVRVHTDDPDEDLPKTILILGEKGVRVLSVSVVKPTLEDVFLKLTGRRLEE
ncbi:MAG: ABC transporter ATP-binding protein [Candidatus Brockarchaeota archaeon]|nr:ABC transporter ATP-binding protein [Candidatus Brockarchaeota archaeon]MBO3808393.1 ABC transporter ATP-binding protein [Candidatus Brockarchaeota archaeon]